MSFYNESSWPAAGRQPSWEQPQPPSRSGASSTVNRDEAVAFAAQFEEVDRAAENLMKSGKFGFPPMANRRDSMPMVGGGSSGSSNNGGGGGNRQFPEYDPRMSGPQRHHSVSEYDGMRSHSASNVQGYYQSQRYAPRPNDADQMAQAKRRMAAQRERELRNYHQEQQYHRNVSGSKSDRSMSPSMSEEERRELIARQHRALYGEQSQLYGSNNPTSSQDARVNPPPGANRGPSPLAFDPFGMQKGQDSAVQMPSRDKDASGGAQEARANSNSSPSSNQNPTFSLFDNAQQASRTSNSSPGTSPPRQGSKGASGPAPIGTRPAANQNQPAGAPLSKRSTTPLPSPLSYAYNASEQNGGGAPGAASSASLNPSSTVTDNVGGIWNKSGVWGNNTQGVQASVWG